MNHKSINKAHIIPALLVCAALFKYISLIGSAPYSPSQDGEPGVTVMIVPVQSIYLSDYDFSTPQNLPLLFTITVSTAGYENLEIQAELTHQQLGFVASAIKVLPTNAGNIFTFDNRMFDSYVTSKSSDEIVESTSGNGTIPPGIYAYTITILNFPNFEPVVEEFIIPELPSGIDLIGPGTQFGSNPTVVYATTPYFEWFGGFDTYDFSIYEVLDGQQSPEEVTNNFPVYEMENINTTNFLYPAYAEILERNKSYAWQITAHTFTSSGQLDIYSEVFWFKFSDGKKNAQEIESIEIGPDDIDIFTGDSVQLIVHGVSAQNETLEMVCQWQVIPSNAGKVTDNNWFVAGSQETTAAVIAEYNGIENYITVNIKKKK